MKKLDYASRRQLQKLHDLSGDRNARKVLDNMKEYISCFRGDNGENIYYLNKTGRERVDCEVIRQKTVQAGHYLMRADAYIHYVGNEDWRNEMKFTVPDVVTVIPDAYFRYNQKRHFLEIDHLQHMSKNREKIDKYRKLQDTGVLQKKIGYFPRLVWVTLAESRKMQLTEWCGEDLNVVIHLWNEIR